MTLSVKNKERLRTSTTDVQPAIESGSTATTSSHSSIVGYARVSTDDQNLGLQHDALRDAGCSRIFEDHGIKGTDQSRPGLDAALSALVAGDVLVVWRLDRLGRSLVHLVSLIHDLTRRGIGVRSLTESFDAASSGGRLIFHLMAALAEFERELIVERTRAGLAAARARGAKIGRPRRFPDAVRSGAVAAVEGGRTVREVVKAYGMHPRTLYRLISAAQRPEGEFAPE